TAPSTTLKQDLTTLNIEPFPTSMSNARGSWRRPSKSRSSIAVIRSQSTPNVQLAVAAAAAATASSSNTTPAVTSEATSPVGHAYTLDKKRNKLGYHRTSVACGMLSHKEAVS